MRENSKLGVGDQIEFVMHLVADGDCGASDQISVGGTKIVRDERPFAVLVQRQGHAGYPTTSRSRAKALQAYDLKFLNGLLGAVHSSLPVVFQPKCCCPLQQGRAA